MCEVSDKIRFCTCNTRNVNRLKHYWVFHKFLKGMDLMVIGQPMLPFYIDQNTDLINRQILLKAVNDPEAFDVPLQPKDGDRLQLTFTCRNELLNYGFSFKEGKWVEEVYDSLEWMWHHKEESVGKITKALR